MNLIRCELSKRGAFVQRTNVGTFYNIPSWAFKLADFVQLCTWLREHARPVKIGIPGQSDLCGHRPGDGRAWYIEVKRPGEEPRENQERFLRQMRNSGALAGCAHSVEEAVGIVFGETEGLKTVYAVRKVYAVRACTGKNPFMFDHFEPVQERYDKSMEKELGKYFFFDFNEACKRCEYLNAHLDSAFEDE